jgi:hypothetical protein
VLSLQKYNLIVRNLSHENITTTNPKHYEKLCNCAGHPHAFNAHKSHPLSLSPHGVPDSPP